MTKIARRIIPCLLVLTLILSFLPIGTTAAEVHTLWVSPVHTESATEMPISAVKWYKKKNTFYLLLPSEARGARLQLWFPTTDTLTIDNGSTLYYNGSFTKALTEGDHTVSMDGMDYPVRVMYSKNIGAMYIDAVKGLSFVHQSKDNKDKGTMRMVNADGSKVYYEGALTQLKGRGNATWYKPKKPYQIKTDKKVELVDGAGKHKTWLLLANYGEQTMVRNTFVYDLANDVNPLKNNSQMQFVDLYVDNEYQGTYSVCEKVEIGDNRIEITDLEGETEDVNPDVDLDSFERFGPNVPEQSSGKGYKIENDPEDITGGYLLEVESHPRYQNEVSGFVTSRGQAMVIKEPEYASEAQVAYISNYFQEFEDALYSADGINPKTGKRYDEYFDLSSMARRYIIEELTRNIDSNATSQFYYKPADGEGAIGYCDPVWDYDNSLGNYSNTREFSGWTAANKSNSIDRNATYQNPYTTNCKYYGQMKTHKSFMNAVVAEWNASFLPVITEALGTTDNPNTFTKPLSFYTTHLGTSAKLNHVVWNTLTDRNIQNLDTGGPTYGGTIDYLKRYIDGRSQWLTSQWPLSSVNPLLNKEEGVVVIVPMSEYTPSATYYTVSNEAEMRAFSDLVNNGTTFEGKTVLQTADIHLTQLSGSRIDTHNRIGKVANGTNPSSSSQAPYPFKGTYNGGGHKIYNLIVDRENRSGVGLFGAAYNATFIDVHVASGHLIGGTRVGGIVGMGDNCTFIRCSNAATVEVTGYSGTFTFNGTDGAGIAGIARENSSFISCYNTGTITGVTGLAGICGFSNFGTLSISNCYNIGSLVFTGEVEGSPISRQKGDGITHTDCYSLEGATPEGMTDQNVTPTFTAEQLTDGTLLNLLNQEEDLWQAGESYPVHKPARTPVTLTVTEQYKAGETLLLEKQLPFAADKTYTVKELHFLDAVSVNGVPLEEDSFEVKENTTVVYHLKASGKPISQLNEAGIYYLASAEDLETLLVTTHADSLKDYTFYLLCNIDASEITAKGGTFAGTLNGKGATVSGLKVPLFESVTATGKVTKLTLKNAAVTGAGAVAQTNHGTVSYITTDNLAIHSAVNAGGIVALNEGFIFACHTQGYVIADSLAGGIAATNNGSVRNCINEARVVSATQTAGGIAAAGTGTAADSVSAGMLNAKTAYPITPIPSEDCFAWDRVWGTKGAETTINDLTLQSADFADGLNPVFWKHGQKTPLPRLTAGELGDFSNDDRVDLTDVTLMLQYLIGGTVENVNPANGNLLGDTLGTEDATCLLRHLLGEF